MRTVAILPVKSFPEAKQRLATAIPASLRQSLAEEMLRDVLTALGQIEHLVRVVVVSPSSTARSIAEQSGAVYVSDTGAGHNAAAARGIEAALQLGAERVLLVPGDCPALDPAEVDWLLASRRAIREVVVVPDRHGTGTNALLLTPPDVLAPSFGPGSCARHVAHAGQADISCEVLSVPSLGLDIDVAADLEVLAERGPRARHTLQLLARC